MLKADFLLALEKKLSWLPKSEILERINFYSEMIDDRIEDGLSEEEAISEIGSSDKIADDIIRETPLIKLAKERITPNRRLKAWEVALISVGSPLWLALGISAFAIVIALFASLWSVIISLWAAFASAATVAAVGPVLTVIYFVSGKVSGGLLCLGASIFLLGFAILLFPCCKAATKGALRLTSLIALKIKKCFVK